MTIRRTRRTLAALVLAVCALIVPATAATARTTTPTAAAATPYWHASAPIYNANGHIADAYLWLNLDTGDVHAEVASVSGGEIQGSVIKLETSGYVDFRNIPYSWSRTVPTGYSYTNTPDIRYNNYGNNWWWKACGYVGSGHACTGPWKFTYAVGLGFQEIPG